jgi:hypothetical protein
MDPAIFIWLIALFDPRTFETTLGCWGPLPDPDASRYRYRNQQDS